MSKFKKWSDLEGQPISFDVNSTTEEAMQATDHPSRIHLTTDGRVVMNGVILGDRNPQRRKWDGSVVVNKAIPCYARAGMAYFFSDGVAKFKFKNAQLEESAASYGTQTAFQSSSIIVYNNGEGYAQCSKVREYNDAGNIPTVSTLCSIKDQTPSGVSFAVAFDSSPIIVVILKDGNIFEEGKYKIIRNMCLGSIPTRSPYYIIQNGHIFFTKNPCIQTYPEAAGGVAYSNKNVFYRNPLTWRYLCRKRVRYYNNDSKTWEEKTSQRRTVMRLLNKENSNSTMVLHPTFRDARGRRTIVDLGSWVCRWGGGYSGEGGARVRITPIRRAYTKKGNYLR